MPHSYRQLRAAVIIMAGKMEPEDAFRLIGNRGQGVKNRSSTDDSGTIDAEDQLIGVTAESPRWFRYGIIAIVAIVTGCFIILLSRGAFLLIDKKAPAPETSPQEEPLVTFTGTEVEELITARLKEFLVCTDTQQRLQHVLSPNTEKEAMLDYYENRGNLDAALWQVKLVKSANLDGGRIWMVAYLDVHKTLHYMRFERSGNDFYIQWAPSFGYGELSWDEFARSQPSEPIQMRCYILRHTGTMPPGVAPASHMLFVVENKRGEFTSTAVMYENSEGFHQLSKLPIGARSPVNLKLHYKDLPTGIRQLTISRLLHFQWHQNTMGHMGVPVKLRR